MLKKLLTCMACAAVTVFAVENVKELEKDRLFDADFAAMWQAQTVDAQFATGSPKGIILQGTRPTFDADPTEAICQGIIVGEDCAAIRYQTEGNFAPESGTFEVVFANNAWDGNSAGTYMIASCLGKNSTLYIYKHGNDGVGVYLGNPNPKWSCFPRVLAPKFTVKGRHHLVFTYTPTEVRLYMDGNLVRDYKPGGAFGGWNKYFDIGASGKFGRQNKTTIARFTTYKRALEGKEIRMLAALRLPHLKLDVNKGVDKVVLPQSLLLYQTERLGLEALEADWVPSPFSPVERKGALFRVWNREYDFGGNELLKGVTCGGKQMLKAPLALVGKHEGKQFSLQFSPVKDLTIDAKGRKAFVRTIIAPAFVKGQVTTTIEYDGAVSFDFKGLKGLEKTEFLSLLTQTEKAFAESAHYTGTTGRSLRTIVGPDVSYTHLLSQDKTGDLIVRPFCTHVWLGGTNGGIMLFHDDDKAFWPKDRQDSFVWERTANGEAARLNARYVLPGTKVPEGGLAEFNIGLIATPVRPLPKGWRAWTISAQYDRLQGEARGNLLVYWPDGWKSQVSLDPDPERAGEKVHATEVRNADHAAGRKVLPYWNHRNVGVRRENVSSPDAEYLRANFGPNPSRPDAGGPRAYVRVNSNTGYTDYLMRCIAAWGRVFGSLDGTYIDEMENVCNDNAKQGCGYTTPDGERRLTYSIYSDRDMYKRMDAVVRMQTGGTTPYSMSHCSGMLMMELLSHFQVMLTGEHQFSGYFPHRKDLLPPENDRLYYYSYSLPMDRVRTEFYHKPWGIVMAYLPCLKNQRDIMELKEPTRDLLSRLMHVDILWWPLWCNAQEIYKVQKWRKEFDIGNDAVEFVPYWENKEITSTTPDACISYYSKNGEYLVIVSNLARSQSSVKVRLPKGAKAVQNAETKEAVAIANGEVTLTIPRNDFCPLRIR